MEIEERKSLALKNGEEASKRIQYTENNTLHTELSASRKRFPNNRKQRFRKSEAGANRIYRETL
jgi:hypothetical protein